MWFKSISKTWYSIISDPQFCNKLHCVRPSVLICQNSKTFSTITIESLLTAKNKAPTPLSLPWETEDINPLPSEPLRILDMPGNHFISSCNGLVCVEHVSSKSGRGGSGGHLILWNPLTRIFRRLPRCSGVRKGCHYLHFVWFGYDESIDDYKLVWVDYYQNNPRETKLNVFTLKSNAWRRTDDCRLYQRLGKVDDFGNHIIIGVLSNGAIHWRTSQKAILALDLATESFEVLDFTNYPFDPRGGGNCLVRGCTCMYDVGLGGISLQIMKEYGLGGIVLHRWEIRKYYPIIFSSGKEILVVFDRVCKMHVGRKSFDHRIIKFRIEEGAGENVSSPETVLDVTNGISD